jgi:tRNA uridine 5-carbamoylmethylation protein Kti12
MPISPQTIQRDQKNAFAAKDLAQEKLKNVGGQKFLDDITGTYTRINKALLEQYNSDQRSLIAIREHPFHAMAEVKTVHEKGRTISALWYANENTATTQVLEEVVIVPWTHPGFQIAITEDLEQSSDIHDPRYMLSEITPLSRARFQKVIPEIVGIYDPGGHVGHLDNVPSSTGLKAVKLQMTSDQVKAFISKMKGVLFVTGAPGSGKTTVAFQRMRFLFDEGDRRTGIQHSSENSKVFLANENLISHSKDLLEKHLDISSSVVSLIKSFIEEYVDDAWRFKNDALFLPRDIPNILQRRAREAFFSTCLVNEMKECWKTYELQIVERISDVSISEWAVLRYGQVKQRDLLRELLNRFDEFAKRQKMKSRSTSPLSSEVNMDRLFQHCARQYDDLRSELSRPEVEQFDGLFSKWLYFVYDPLNPIFTTLLTRSGING